MKERKRVKGFKGFFKIGKIFKCRDMIYKLGETFTKPFKKKELELCTDKGLHYCKDPQHVWDYYMPSPFTVYSGVKAGASCHDEICYKSVTNSLKVGAKLYSPYEYAKTFFPRSDSKHNDSYFSGYCYSAATVVIGHETHQCMEGPVDVITIDAKSMAKGLLAYTSGTYSFAQGTDFAVAPRGSAEAEIAVGRFHVKTGKHGVAIGIASGAYEYGTVLSGGLEAHLVFLVWERRFGTLRIGKVKVFKVDGKEVKANIPYQYDADQDKLVPWEGM